MSRWGELIPHDEDAGEEGSCLCGCCDEAPVGDGSGDAATWSPPVDEYRLSSRPDVVSGDA